MDKLEKTIRGLECCLNTGNFEECTENCPYFTKKLGMGVCSENMKCDALALLKEKEPKIISLKELMCLSRNTPIYTELRNDIHGWEIYDGFDHQTEGMITGPLWGPHEFWDSSEYGRTWRCWTSQPTDKQRKAVRWE